MSEFDIRPYMSVGNINLGESRDSVRSRNGNYKEFRKTKFSKNTTDDFSGFHVFYDVENKVKAVEFFENVYMDGIDLFSKTYNELKDLFADPSDKEEDSVMIFMKYGFSVFSPDKKTVETVLVFNKGYYD